MTDEGADSPTPEETADLPERIVKALLDNQRRVRQLFRRWLIVSFLVIGLGVGYVSWTVHQVRSSQLTNTKCNQMADHDIAFDLKAVVRPGETPKRFLAEIKIPASKC